MLARMFFLLLMVIMGNINADIPKQEIYEAFGVKQKSTSHSQIIAHKECSWCL